ncbi:MAG: hypothetical protein O3C27_08595 [Actinomycetota bacterium]|nr:hypothetical protein [Actinomycetota bacterium]
MIRPVEILWVIPAAWLAGVGITLLATADLGLSPMDSVVFTAVDATGLRFTVVAWSLNGALAALGVALSLASSSRFTMLWIGVVYLALLGPAVGLSGGWFTQSGSLAARCAMWTAGFVLVTASLAIVVGRLNAGAGFEIFCAGLSALAGVDPFRVRVIAEVARVVGAVAVAGFDRVGAGTALLAVGTAPTLRVLVGHWSPGAR